MRSYHLTTSIRITRGRIMYLPLLFVMFDVCLAINNTSPVADSTTFWIDSVMLRHILRWHQNHTGTYTVQWQYLHGKRWYAVPNCTTTASTTCDLSATLKRSTLTYNVRLRTNTTVLGSLEFCPEFNTTLLAPEFKAKRHGNDVFVRPTTPRNLGTGKPLSDELMTVVYQLKYWEKASPSNFTILKMSMGHTELNFKVIRSKPYCLTMRLYDKHYAAINASSARSVWGEVQCLHVIQRNAQDLSHMVIIAVLLSTLLLVSSTAYGYYRIRKMRKKSRDRDKTFINMLDKIFATRQDNEHQCNIELKEDVNQRLNNSVASSLNSQNNQPYITCSSLIAREGHSNLYGETAYVDYHRDRSVRRERAESRGYHSASSHCTTTYDDGGQFDENDYLPADAVFSEVTGNVGSRYSHDRSFSFSDMSDISIGGGAPEQSQCAPTYVISERSQDGGSFDGEEYHFGEFTGMNPNYSSDNNRSIPDLLLLVANNTRD